MRNDDNFKLWCYYFNSLSLQFLNIYNTVFIIYSISYIRLIITAKCNDLLKKIGTRKRRLGPKYGKKK